ncbi:MAG: SDR family oxidoreductase [Bryobacter sp.]|nr:SDR family oxidoreductase [Bryobacter sp.]
MSSSTPFSLAGQRALVAGASRGIGLVIARAIAAAGAETTLAARSFATLEAEAAQLREQGFSAHALALDMADPASLDAAAQAAPWDILINVSGTNVRKRFEDYTAAEYDSLFQTNLHGLARLTQQVGKGMIERGRGGSIIQIGSLTSLQGLPYLAIYAMTKSALAGLTRALAAEWGAHGITVNCIAPGFIVTDLNRAMWQPEEMHAWLRATQALPRTGTPEDIAPLAVFLASPGARYITGQVIAADGGSSTTKVWPFAP